MPTNAEDSPTTTADSVCQISTNLFSLMSPGTIEPEAEHPFLLARFHSCERFLGIFYVSPGYVDIGQRENADLDRRQTNRCLPRRLKRQVEQLGLRAAGKRCLGNPYGDNP